MFKLKAFPWFPYIFFFPQDLKFSSHKVRENVLWRLNSFIFLCEESDAKISSAIVFALLLSFLRIKYENEYINMEFLIQLTFLILVSLYNNVKPQFPFTFHLVQFNIKLISVS